MTDVNAGQHLRVAVQEFDEIVSIREGREVIRDVSGLAPDVRMHREIPLAALDEVTRLRKRELEAAVLEPGKAARVVPVQVSGDDRVHLIRPDPQPPQGMKQTLWLSQHDLLCALLA